MVEVTDGTNGDPTTEAPEEPTARVQGTEQQPVEPVVASSTASQRRVWSMPTSPVTRRQADKLGRGALRAATNVATFVAGIARYGARVIAQAWRALDAVPPALKAFVAVGLLLLLGLTAAIALDNSLGLLCVIVVVPVCSITLGALAQRWYGGLGHGQTRETATRATEPATSDLRRSVEYVDNKLATALTAFGTDRHQQALIAVFQAKTAVELTLGTEHDSASYDDLAIPTNEQNLRPRIRVGAKSMLRESNSLAAS